jgi:hypothetical protein
VSDSPPVAAVAATLLAFVARSAALRAVVLLDRGQGAPPAVLDCDADGTVEVEERGAVRTLAGTEVAADPLPLPEIRALPPMDVDAQRGEVIGMIGGLQHLTDAVGALAAVLGGRSVATVQFETTDPRAPLAVSARPGEPAVLALGDEPFALS